MRNQGVVGRVLTRHVGLKPDLRSNKLSGIIPHVGENILAFQQIMQLFQVRIYGCSQSLESEAATNYQDDFSVNSNYH